MEKKIAHLGFIQGIITRMGGNSFLLKGWSVTLIAAMFALAVKDADKRFMILAFFPVFIFWWLDGFFLRQEKLYRKLYEEVANSKISSDVFTLDATVFKNHVPKTIFAMFSQTVWPFHVILVLLIIYGMATLSTPTQ